jgi:rubrerythrin
LNEKDTLQFLDRQIELENRIVKKVEQNTAGLGNLFVKDLLRGIAHDSRKHATLLNGLKAILQNKVPLITEDQRDTIARGIEEHMQLEADAIQAYARLVESSGNNAIKTIAAIIREDEIAHHKLLVDLHKTLVAPQTLEDEALWDMLWKDSPWHGSPGG